MIVILLISIVTHIRAVNFQSSDSAKYLKVGYTVADSPEEFYIYLNDTNLDQGSGKKDYEFVVYEDSSLNEADI